MQTLEANKQLTMPDGSTFVVVESRLEQRWL